MNAGDRVAATALGAVGAPFRLHGRDPANGFDCVGLVAHALAAGGYVGGVPTGYRLRSADFRGVAAMLDAALAPAGADRAGDVVLMRPGPAQLHLGIRVVGGMVHADAGLRRVVERPGAAPWPVIGRWRVEVG